jgi:type IV pilus assembly protein PilP
MIKKLPPKNSHVSTVIILLISLALLEGCSKDQATTSAPTASSQPQQTGAAPAKPVLKPTSSATLRVPPPSVNQFDFSNKKDPFKPFVAAKVEQKKAPDASARDLRNALPIHSFDVSQFKLIGIITGGRENQAMVTDPGGKGYVLKIGMMIGKNDGKIVSINSSGVDVVEQFKDDNGKVRKENIKLTLPRKQ